jgi:hypothetical protein
VLAQSVVENSKKAVRYLQYAARFGQFIFISSRTPSYIDTRTAKALGFFVVPEMVGSIPILLCQKEFGKDRVQGVISRSEKRAFKHKVIDLHCSSNPSTDIKDLLASKREYFEQAEELDLSWSYILKNEMEFLSEIINLYKNFKRVIIGPSDIDWGIELSALCKTAEFIVRTDSPNKTTLEYASIQAHNRLGFFDGSLPTNAALIYQIAADIGNMLAAYKLANIYKNGKDCKPNYIQAAKYYQIAADQGHAISQYLPTR